VADPRRVTRAIAKKLAPSSRTSREARAGVSRLTARSNETRTRERAHRTPAAARDQSPPRNATSKSATSPKKERLERRAELMAQLLALRDKRTALRRSVVERLNQQLRPNPVALESRSRELDLGGSC